MSFFPQLKILESTRVTFLFFVSSLSETAGHILAFPLQTVGIASGHAQCCLKSKCISDVLFAKFERENYDQLSSESCLCTSERHIMHVVHTLTTAAVPFHHCALLRSTILWDLVQSLWDHASFGAVVAQQDRKRRLWYIPVSALQGAAAYSLRTSALCWWNKWITPMCTNGSKHNKKKPPQENNRMHFLNILLIWNSPARFLKTNILQF